ncbi:MAG: Ldh family oxidoreductase [Candidatus Cloacimonetes bacterium]|nr:Ldh family oxidoreductase [Candidatus Cloacimonadota bacterium]
MLHLPVNQMHEFMITVFSRIGVPEDEARICADVLIASDLKGIESHGIGRLKMYYDRIKLGIQKPTTRIEIIRDRKATAVWDGNHGMGHVIAHKAMQTAIDKARILAWAAWLCAIPPTMASAVITRKWLPNRI